jgi:hypothetical protein
LHLCESYVRHTIVTFSVPYFFGVGMYVVADFASTVTGSKWSRKGQATS